MFYTIIVNLDEASLFCYKILSLFQWKHIKLHHISCKTEKSSLRKFSLISEFNDILLKGKIWCDNNISNLLMINNLKAWKSLEKFGWNVILINSEFN